MKYFLFLLFIFCTLTFSPSSGQIIRNYENIHAYVQYIHSSVIILPDSLIDLEYPEKETYSGSHGNYYLLQLEYKNLEVVFEEVDELQQDSNAVSYVNDSTYTPADLYYRGYQDARLFYRNTGTFWGAYGVGFLAPFTYGIPSLVAGVAMAVTPPKERNLRYHDRRMLINYSSFNIKETNELFNDINYSRGYRKGAHIKKLGSVGGGVAAGVGTSLILVIIVYVAFLGFYY